MKHKEEERDQLHKEVTRSRELLHIRDVDAQRLDTSAAATQTNLESGTSKLI